ncbi:hypothetical protein JVU11DRAFT_1007 [Chiua virens]|nr:hypothetical protein JVU11DRAFT_1007 [Chiua virens]
MYPKTSFKDTINRVEKLCHTKRMQCLARRIQGHTKGKKSDGDPDVIDLTEPTLVASEDDDALGDKTSENHQLKSNQASSPTSSLPPASSEPGDDDFDIDAVIRAEEERLATLRTGTTARASPPPCIVGGRDDDFDIDAELKAEEDRLAILRSAKADSVSPHASPYNTPGEIFI